MVSGAYSKVRLVLAGGEGFHRKRMQGTCQLLGQCPVDHSLPRHLWGALEGLGLNDDVKMALAGVAGPRMSRVAIGVVYDLQTGRRERVGELMLDGLKYGAHLDNLQFLKGSQTASYLGHGRRVSIQA